MPFGQHFLGYDGQRQGHAAKPPDYFWYHGDNPIVTGDCLTCSYGLPELPPCGCLSSVIYLFINTYVDGIPRTADMDVEFVVGTSFEYRPSTVRIALPAGYELLDSEMSSDLSYWDFFFDTPTGEVTLRAYPTGFCDTIHEVWRGQYGPGPGIDGTIILVAGL